MEAFNITTITLTIITSLVVGAVILVIEYRTGWFAGRRKELTYEIIAATRLLQVSTEIKSRVKIFFDDEPVNDMTLLVMEFTNSGRPSILRDDFEEPIRLSLSPEAKIYEAKLLKASPINLNPLIEIVENPNIPPLNEKIEAKDSANTISPQITISPILLNSGDSFTLGLFLSGYKRAEKLESYAPWAEGLDIKLPGSKVLVEGRIAGVKKIREINREIIKNKRVGFVKLSIGAVVSLLIFYVVFFLLTRNSIFALIVGMIGTTISIGWWLRDNR